MNKEQLISEMDFVKNSKAEIELRDNNGNLYRISDFGTDKDCTIISILVDKI